MKMTGSGKCLKLAEVDAFNVGGGRRQAVFRAIICVDVL